MDNEELVKKLQEASDKLESILAPNSIWLDDVRLMRQAAVALTRDKGMAEDAERYRFLKSKVASDYREDHWRGRMLRMVVHDEHEKGLDQAIDAALSAKGDR